MSTPWPSSPNRSATGTGARSNTMWPWSVPRTPIVSAISRASTPSPRVGTISATVPSVPRVPSTRAKVIR